MSDERATTRVMDNGGARGRGELRAAGDPGGDVVFETSPRASRKEPPPDEPAHESKESGATYRELLEAAPDAMVVVNERGEIVLLNLQAERQFGYHRHELVGQQVRIIIPEGFAERLLADALRSSEDALAQQIGTGIELTARRKDGSEFPIEIMLSPLDSAEGILVTAAIRNISVRKAAEIHLAQMEGRYRGLLEAAPDAMVVVNPGGEIVLLNVQAEKRFGYHRDELVGQPVRNIVPEGFAERLIADALRSSEDALAQQIGTGIELTARRKDGSEFPIEIMLSPLDSAEGILVTAAIRDITVRKAAEIHLAQMEGRYRGLLEAAPDAMVVVNADGAIVLLNAQAEHQFGYRRDELIGQPVKNLIPEGFAERLIADALRSSADALAQQIGTGLELSGRRKDGSEFPIEIMLSPLDSAEGLLVTAAIRDITERKRNEISLRESEERFRATFEQAAVGIAHNAMDGRWLRVNQRCCDILGYTREELLAITFLDVTHPDELAFDQAQMRRFLTGEIRTLSREKRFVHKNGSVVWIDMTVSVARDPVARGDYFIAVLQDITARKELEQELLHAQRMEGVGQLAGGIAHDFNNLLTVIGGRSQLALGKLQPSDPLRRDLDLIQKTADRAAALTRQLLAFSRKQVLQPRVVDPNEVVSGSTSLLKRLIGEHIELVFVPGYDLGRVHVDPGHFEQVIVNLAVNARDAMPDGGQLTIETSNVELDAGDAGRHVGLKAGPYVMLAVSDNGLGMNAATQARIFEPFFTTKGPGKGTGLGLATVYGIVKRSEGHIRVYSEPGVGTVFRIYLPRTDAAPEAHPSGEATPLRGTETILLVEDEAEVRNLAREVLQGLGYTLLEAASAADAVLIAERHLGLIDLLLTDVVMPRMGGGALAEVVTAARPETRTLFMSGYTDDAIVRHGVLEAGVQLLEKPFTPKTLAAKVRAVLDRQS